MDIPLLPGDGAAIRAAAADITSTLPRIRTARHAAVQLEEILAGDHWQGTAFGAFCRVVERKPLPLALDHAAERMGQAAEELAWFAARFDENQARLRHLRAQAAALQASVVDEDQVAAVAAEVRAIEQRAQAVLDDHRGCLDQVAALFDWLDDEPTFATPPPSTWQRVSGVVDGALDGLGDLAEGAWNMTWSFGTGVVEGVRDLVLGIWDLAQLFTPGGASDLWANRAQIGAVLRAAVDDPIGFLGQLGSALLDIDTLLSDPARWVGRRIPDVVLAIVSGGAGAVASRAAGSVRGVRGMQVVARATRAADRATPTAVDAVDGLRRADGLAGRIARLGADESRLAQRGSGAFTRTDVALGRIAARSDEMGSVFEHARQGPGVLLDEIREVTDGPIDAAMHRLPGDLTQSAAAPWIRRYGAGLLTNGFTNRLGMLDGLLVGYPALSPRAYGTIAGVYGVDALNTLADIQDVGQTAVEVGAREGS